MNTPNGRPVADWCIFKSNRDGFGCLWAQHIDGVTKRVIGPPFVVYHFHGTSRTLDYFSSPALDKMVLNLEENTANIWMTELE